MSILWCWEALAECGNVNLDFLDLSLGVGNYLGILGGLLDLNCYCTKSAPLKQKEATPNDVTS